MFIRRRTKAAALSLSLALVLQTTACGFILHPERKGQTGGQIDPAIAILDGIGLLLFIIPGAIAFGVDFYHGTIYLPNGSSAQLNDEQLERISRNDELDVEELERIMQDELGMALDLQASNVQIRPLESQAQMQALLSTQAPTTLARH